MPILSPATTLVPTGSINDLVSLVTDALQQRTDISTLIPTYVALSVRELTETYPFEELKTTGPNVTLTTGTPIYPVSLFTQPGDDWTFIDALVIYIDTPNNTVTNVLRYKTPQAIETILAPATKGIPAWWTRYGQNLHVGPNPTSAFTVFMRYQVKHPFSAPPTVNDAIYMPLSWYDIVAYAAAERIAVVKRWNDQSQYLHDLLYGDPEAQMTNGKRGQPGLISARISQQARDEMFNSRQFMVTIGRYSPR